MQLKYEAILDKQHTRKIFSNAKFRDMGPILQTGINLTSIVV